MFDEVWKQAVMPKASPRAADGLPLRANETSEIRVNRIGKRAVD